MQRTFRKIHLDFHTHPELTGVCSRFDADLFAGVLADAGVDNVVLFAKDHYGYAFFRSVTCPPHPHLEADFLRLAVEACQERGIQTEAYVSVCLDYQTYKDHPDWAAVNRDGTVARWSDVSILLDLASPLVEEVTLPLVEEIVEEIPVDGLWFDIVMYPTDAFYSPFFDAAVDSRGVENTHEERGRLARDMTIEAMQRLYEYVRALRSDMRALFNNQAFPGDRRAFAFSDVIDIESDPTHWPQYDLPLRCRYVRGTGKDHNGLTTRFHRCWGDFGGLRSPAQLEFEIGNIMAAGSAHVSLGDHLHPCGELQEAVYRLIGNAYRHCRKVAPVVEDAEPLSEVALLVEPEPSPYSSASSAGATAQLGATRFLVEEHFQFCVRDAETDPPAGTVLLLPGGRPLPEDIVDLVKAQVAAGHPLIAFANHVQGFEDLVLSPRSVETALSGQQVIAPELVRETLIEDMPIATYRKAFTFDPELETEILGHSLDPLFDDQFPENYHQYGPVDRDAERRPAIVWRDGVLLCGVPLPELIHTEGAWAFFVMMRRLMDRVTPKRLVETEAGPGIEIALHRNRGDLVVHFVASQMPRYGTPPARMRTFEPVYGLKVSIGTGKFPSSVYRLKSREEVHWEFHDEGLVLELDLFEPHEVIVCAGACASD